MALNSVSTDKLLKTTGLNKFQLDNILHGKSRKIDLLIPIAKALGVSLDVLFNPPEESVDSIHHNIIFTSAEVPLCIDLFCKKNKFKLSELCKETILNLIKENSEEVHVTPTLIHQVHGILLLLKKYPELVNILSHEI